MIFHDFWTGTYFAIYHRKHGKPRVGALVVYPRAWHLAGTPPEFTSEPAMLVDPGVVGFDVWNVCMYNL